MACSGLGYWKYGDTHNGVNNLPYVLYKMGTHFHEDPLCIHLVCLWYSPDLHKWLKITEHCRDRIGVIAEQLKPWWLGIYGYIGGNTLVQGRYLGSFILIILVTWVESALQSAINLGSLRATNGCPRVRWSDRCISSRFLQVITFTVSRVSIDYDHLLISTTVSAGP
jgi:hypothetical protein